MAAPNLDQMALWPDDLNPTHLIACNEQDVGDPGLQSIDIASGDVTTLVTGTAECDPVRRTPWGTIVFGEEAGGGAAGGRVYELIDPLAVHDVVLDRDTGTFHDGVGADHFVARPALGRLSFEGLGILANGVVYFGDENRPSNGRRGWRVLQVHPGFPAGRGCRADRLLGRISRSSVAPVFGLRLGVRSGGTDYGQGTNEGSACGCRSRRLRTRTCDRRPPMRR